MHTPKPKKTQEQKHAEAMERVFAKVEVTGFCWLWTAAKTTDGYGLTKLYGRTECAHRAVWMLLMGEIPKGLQLDHLCQIRDCVNPDHLEPVTKRENAARMTERKGWVHGEATKRPFGPQPKPQPPKTPVRTAPLKPLMSQRKYCKNGHLVADLGVRHKMVNGKPYEACVACGRKGDRLAKAAKRVGGCQQGLCKHVKCGTLPKKSYSAGATP